MTDPLGMSLPALAAALRARAVSATEVVQRAIERHERLDDRLRAYKLFDPERALAAARAADRVLGVGGDDVPPLTGVPVSVKDLYGVDGLPTYAGTPRQLPEKWSRDAWLVARVRAAGGIIMGKTHTVEMAFGGVGLNPHWETPRNPWDSQTHRVPGGSSAGAGVSLWEGSALLALGSDTGGSIRIPAALTGTVGQRTTRGRWPTEGVVPLSKTLDTVGALARTVEDYAWFFGSVDPAWGDPRPLLTRLGASGLRGLRLGIPHGGIWADCQPDIADALHAALRDLEAAGARLVEVDGTLLDEGFTLSLGVRPIASTECRAFLEAELPDWIDLLHPIIRARLVNAPRPSDAVYAEALAEHRRLVAEAPRLFEGADVLALPANMITAPAVADVLEMERYGAANKAILRPNYPVSVLGLCGISLPAGLDAVRMPVGLQLVGPGGQDERLIGAALAAERVLGTAPERLGSPPAIA